MDITEKCVTFQFRCRVYSIIHNVKEVMCVIQVLRSMKIMVKYPIMVTVDNVGVKFMAINITIISHTKHMDIRDKYVNEFLMMGLFTLFLLSLLIMTETFSAKI